MLVPDECQLHVFYVAPGIFVKQNWVMQGKPIFPILALNIDCGYTLEPPLQKGF